MGRISGGSRMGRRGFGLLTVGTTASVAAFGLGGCEANGNQLSPELPLRLPLAVGVMPEDVALVLPAGRDDPEGLRNVIIRPVSIPGLAGYLGLRVDDQGSVWPIEVREGYELRAQSGQAGGLTATTLEGVVAVIDDQAIDRLVTTKVDLAGREIPWSVADRDFTIGDALALGGVGLQTFIPTKLVEQLGPVV